MNFTHTEITNIFGEEDDYDFTIDTIKEVVTDLFKLEYKAKNIVEECSDIDNENLATISHVVIEDLLELILKKTSEPTPEVFGSVMENIKILCDRVNKQFKNKNKEILYTEYFMETYAKFSVDVHCEGILLKKKYPNKNNRAFSYFLVKLLNYSVATFNTFTKDDNKCISFEDICNKIKKK